ncbi:oligosaccharide flippase family protein [Pseudoalteromonas sp. ZZD1]|uniref:oligosaccharide flippase family protein n=1 Tax=Pseudoalteromonas sp. ZZD1 TaxID=3139395 RepID=UPI003BABA560
MFSSQLNSIFGTILKNSSLALLVKVIGSAISISLAAIIARYYGPDIAGQYFLLMSIVTYFVVVGSFGQQNAMLQKVSSTGSEEKKFTLLNSSIFIVMIFSIILSCLMYFTSGFISSNIFNKPELKETLENIVFLIPLLSLLNVFSAYYQANNRIIVSMSILGPIPNTIVLALLILVSFSGLELQFNNFILFVIICTFLSLLYSSFMVRGYEFDSLDLGAIKKMLLIGSPMLVVQACMQLNSLIGQFSLGVWGTTTDIAFFAIANKIAILISLILTSVNKIAAPKFSELYSTGNYEELKVVVKNSSRLMLLFSFPFLLILLMCPKWVLSFFGEEFEAASQILRILAVAQFINVSTGSVGFILLMTGRQKVARNNMLLSLFIAISLSIIIVPVYGAIGAAIVTLLSLSTSNLLSWYTVKKELKINTFKIL